MAKKKNTLGDVLFTFLHEVLLAFFEDMREKGMKAFPLLMKRVVHRLITRYIWLIILGITGLLLIALALAELLATVMTSWVAYLVIGIILLLIGVAQYHYG